MQFSLTDVTALGALIFGVAGFVLSVVNYLRDRAKIVVTLQWDMKLSTTGELAGIVSVSNTGRRPAYVSHAALKMPKGAMNSHIILVDSIGGTKLEEGAAPLIYIVRYDEALYDERNHWKGIRAQISDTTGKEWISKRISSEKEPSWVRTS